MKKIFKNWKTSLAGLGALITGVTMYIGGQKMEGLVAVLTALGLINAKDDTE